jgi:hypothetical protein
MMMYQILCGHACQLCIREDQNASKKTKRHFILDPCLYKWWFELMVINVVFKFGPVELMVGL